MSQQNLLLEELTSPEVKRALQDGYTTIVVAVGAVCVSEIRVPVAFVAVTSFGVKLVV